MKAGRKPVAEKRKQYHVYFNDEEYKTIIACTMCFSFSKEEILAFRK